MVSTARNAVPLGACGGAAWSVLPWRRYSPLTNDTSSTTTRYPLLTTRATHHFLQDAPIFLPAVGDFAQGMVVSVPLHYGRDLSDSTVEAGGVGEAIHAALSKHYASDHFVTVSPLATDPHPHPNPHPSPNPNPNPNPNLTPNPHLNP